MNICSITISGLVNRVEVKNIGGTPLCKLGVKVRVGFGEKARNVFFNVDIWGKSGESAMKQLKDGSPVVISGKLEPREYEGKNGTSTSLDIRCTDWAKPRSFEEANSQARTERIMAQPGEVPF